MGALLWVVVRVVFRGCVHIERIDVLKGYDNIARVR